MVLQIDQDGPIALPPPPRPLAHADDVRGGGVGHRGGLHQPQQGIGAGPPLEAGREPSACLATEGDAEGTQGLGEPQRPVRPRRHHGGQAFRKNLAWTRRIVTEKLPHAEVQTHGVGAPRHISHGACISAVDARGLHMAERAGAMGVGRDRVQYDLRGRIIDVPRL